MNSLSVCYTTPHVAIFACGEVYCFYIVCPSVTLYSYAPPRNEKEHIVLPLSIRTCARLFVVLSVGPQLLVRYLIQGFETYNTVQTCIEHVQKETEFSFRALLQKYVPFNNIHI